MYAQTSSVNTLHLKLIKEPLLLCNIRREKSRCPQMMKEIPCLTKQGTHRIGNKILTFEDIPALQLFHGRSLAQSPTEEDQNHVLDHLFIQFPTQSLSKSLISRPIACARVSNAPMCIS